MLHVQKTKARKTLVTYLDRFYKKTTAKAFRTWRLTYDNSKQRNALLLRII